MGLLEHNISINIITNINIIMELLLRLLLYTR